MNPALEGVWKQMRELGLGALAHATTHAVFAPMENAQWPQLSVLQAAHAGELLIKARIAEEHPLLIFEQLPTLRDVDKKGLDFKDLFEQGKTVQWTGLPDRLWAVTGIKLPNQPLFYKFGKVRNGIQHFAPHPGRYDDLNDQTLRFIFGVIDPFINSCWGLFAIDYHEDQDYGYGSIIAGVAGREIPFLVSPGAAEEFAVPQSGEFDFLHVSKKYKDEMHSRAQRALGSVKK